ncbi:HAD family hydrolase [Bacillus sp. CLL-7-23]|uniref:HAD family hydrolase n=1 Tax=Bacillus changyiensis TaxID=3004103 RepID=A0ABT4X7C7_9BACI|nr:HAD family hydrolase [Bacillus changyiensis]MDA7028179.1 HAD family hydrolase [Bacillus changyiensis]
MIKAIIFDFDGLILDTETHDYEVLQEIFQEHGSDLPMSVWGKVIGTAAGFEPFSYLEEQLQTKLDHNELTNTRKERFLKRMENEKPRAGVEAYITAAKELGLKIGLASSSDYKWITQHLKQIGLYDDFECIKTADDVKEVKPNPELYLQAATCLAVKPEECLAFEDSVNGSIAAKRAGMKCVIVPNKVTKSLLFEQYDHRLESMAEMELEQLIQKVSQ